VGQLFGRIAVWQEHSPWRLQERSLNIAWKILGSVLLDCNKNYQFLFLNSHKNHHRPLFFATHLIRIHLIDFKGKFSGF
jgi:hypothetical protein